MFARLRPLLPIALFTLALGGALWRAPQAAPTTAEASPTSRQATEGEVSRADIPDSAAGSTLSLVQLADGRLAAAWAVPGENPAILFSRREGDGWQKPELAANRESTAGGGFAYVSRIDAPVLYAEGGWLHLWYAGHPSDSTSLPQLQHQVSTDGGQHWQAPRRLPTAPFGGLAASGRPLPLADGGLALLGQSGGKASWLRFSATGRLLDLIRLPAEAVQHAACAALADSRALCLLRTAGAPALQRRLSADGGQTWENAAAGDLQLANSPFALLALADGRLLLAGNPASGTGTLTLWLSTDQGEHWQVAKQIAEAADGAADFRAPSLLALRDGRLALAYPDRRRGWRVLEFAPAWLDGGQA